MPLTLSVPSSVQEVARVALRLHKDASRLDEVRGVRVADLLASGSVSADYVAVIHSFFESNAVPRVDAESQHRTFSNSAVLRSWQLHGGDAGRRWAAQQFKRLVDEDVIEPDPLLALMKLPPEDVYERFSMGAWRYEYGLNTPQKAARFVEEYTRATNRPLDIHYAFPGAVKAVGNALYRRFSQPDLMAELAKALVVEDAAYQTAATLDMQQCPSFAPLMPGRAAQGRSGGVLGGSGGSNDAQGAKTRQNRSHSLLDVCEDGQDGLDEAIKFTTLTTLNPLQAAKIVWPILFAYFALAVEQRELLKEVNTGSMRPAGYNEKLKSFVSYNDAINIMHAYFHPQGSRYVDPDDYDAGDAKNPYSGLDLEVMELAARVWKGQPVTAPVVRALLMRMKQWMTINKFAGAIFNTLVQDWNKGNWQGMLDKLPVDSDIRPALELFTGKGKLPVQPVVTDVTHPETDRKLMAYLKGPNGIFSGDDNIVPLPLKETKSYAAAIKVGITLSIEMVLSVDGAPFDLVGAYDDGYKAVIVLRRRLADEDGAVGSFKYHYDAPFSKRFAKGAAFVLQMHKDLPTTVALPEQPPTSPVEVTKPAVVVNPADAQKAVANLNPDPVDATPDPESEFHTCAEDYIEDTFEDWQKFRRIPLAATKASPALYSAYAVHLAAGQVFAKGSDRFIFGAAFRDPSGKDVVIYRDATGAYSHVDDSVLTTVVIKGSAKLLPPAQANAFVSKRPKVLTPVTSLLVPAPSAPEEESEDAVLFINDIIKLETTDGTVTCLVIAKSGDEYMIQPLDVTLQMNSVESGEGIVVYRDKIEDIDAGAVKIGEYVPGKPATLRPFIAGGASYKLVGADTTKMPSVFKGGQTWMTCGLGAVLPAPLNMHLIGIRWVPVEFDKSMPLAIEFAMLASPTTLTSTYEPEPLTEPSLAGAPEKKTGMCGTLAAMQYMVKNGLRFATKDSSAVLSAVLFAHVTSGDVEGSLVGYALGTDKTPLFVVQTNGGLKHVKAAACTFTPVMAHAAEPTYPPPWLNYSLGKEAKKIAKEKGIVFGPSPKKPAYYTGTKLILKESGQECELLGWHMRTTDPKFVAVMGVKLADGSFEPKDFLGDTLKSQFSVTYKSKTIMEPELIVCGKNVNDKTPSFGIGEQTVPAALPVGWASPLPVNQPPFKGLKKGTKVAAGFIVIVKHPTINYAARVVLVRPLNDFGGKLTLTKGTVEKGEGIVKAAVREFYEETGMSVKPVQFIGDFISTSGSINRMFLGVVTGGNPYMAGQHPNGTDETDAVILHTMHIKKLEADKPVLVWDKKQDEWTKDLDKWQVDAIEAAFDLLQKKQQWVEQMPVDVTLHDVIVTAEEDVKKKGAKIPVIYDPKSAHPNPGWGEYQLGAAEPLDYAIIEPDLFKKINTTAKGTFAPAETWVNAGYPPPGASVVYGTTKAGKVYTVLAYGTTQSFDFVVLRSADGEIIKPFIGEKGNPPEAFKPAPGTGQTVRAIPVADDKEAMLDAWTLKAPYPFTDHMANALSAWITNVGAGYKITGVTLTRDYPGAPAYGSYITLLPGDATACRIMGYATLEIEGGNPVPVALTMAGASAITVYLVSAVVGSEVQNISAKASGAYYTHPEPTWNALLRSVAMGNVPIGNELGTLRTALVEAQVPHALYVTKALMVDVCSLFLDAPDTVTYDFVTNALAKMAQIAGKGDAKIAAAKAVKVKGGASLDYTYSQFVGTWFMNNSDFTPVVQSPYVEQGYPAVGTTYTDAQGDTPTVFAYALKVGVPHVVVDWGTGLNALTFDDVPKVDWKNAKPVKKDVYEVGDFVKHADMEGVVTYGVVSVVAGWQFTIEVVDAETGVPNGEILEDGYTAFVGVVPAPSGAAALIAQYKGATPQTHGNVDFGENQSEDEEALPLDYELTSLQRSKLQNWVTGIGSTAFKIVLLPQAPFLADGEPPVGVTATQENGEFAHVVAYAHIKIGVGEPVSPAIIYAKGTSLIWQEAGNAQIWTWPGKGETVPVSPSGPPAEVVGVAVFTPDLDYASDEVKALLENPNPELFVTSITKKVTGGSNPIGVLDGPNGTHWFIKGSKDHAPQRTYGELAASRVAALLDANTLPTGIIQHNGEPWLISPLIDGETLPADPTALSDEDKGEILAMHAIDMFLQDQDGHERNFLRVDGRIVRIDRGQAFRFYAWNAEVSLDPNENPNHSVPLPKQLLRRWVNKTVEIPNSAFGKMRAMILAIQSLTDEQITTAIQGYLDVACDKPAGGMGQGKPMSAADKKKMVNRIFKVRDGYLAAWTTTLTKLRSDFEWPPAALEMQIQIGGFDTSPKEFNFGEREEKALEIVKKVGWRGYSLRIDRSYIENQEVHVKQVVGKGAGAAASTATMIIFRLTKQAAQIATAALKKMASVLSADPTVPHMLPFDSMSPGEPFYGTILKGVKTLNNHLFGVKKDGVVKTEKIDKVKAVKLSLQQIADATTDPKGEYQGVSNVFVHDMATSYLQVANSVITLADNAKEIMASGIGEALPTFEPYKYLEPPKKGEKVKKPSGVTVTYLPSGFAFPAVSNEYDATSGKPKLTLTLGNVKEPSSGSHGQFRINVASVKGAVVTVSPAGGGIEGAEGTATYQGQCWGTIPGDASPANVAALLKIFQQLTGIGMQAADKLDQEVLYLANQAAAVRSNGSYAPTGGVAGADSGEIELAMNDYANGSREEARDKLASFVASRLKIPGKTVTASTLKKLPNYGVIQPVRFMEGGKIVEAGYVRSLRLGWTREMMVKMFGSKCYVACGLTVDTMLSFMEKVTKANGALISNFDRPFLGVPMSGGSYQEDLSRGGSVGTFLRMRKVPPFVGNHLYFDLSLLLRTDVYINQSDSYGSPSAHRWTTPEVWKDNDAHTKTGHSGPSGGFQVVARHDVDLRQYLRFAIVESASDVQAVRNTVATRWGADVTFGPENRKIEDVFVTAKQAK